VKARGVLTRSPLSVATSPASCQGGMLEGRRCACAKSASLARLQTRTNRVEQRRELGSECEQGNQCSNGNAGQNEAVFDQPLAFFPLRQICSNEPCKSIDQLNLALVESGLARPRTWNVDSCKQRPNEKKSPV
jgi:hypothetical protein